MRLCESDRCDKAARKRGFCNTHYAAALRGGAIQVQFQRDPVVRFWSRVQRSADCWVWTGGKNMAGYGQFRFEGRQQSAHRIAYLLEVGPIPSGLDLDHLCRNRACVRPAHLEPVTPGENLRRGFGASGVNARKTHCPAGHEYSGENLRLSSSGDRKCAACVRQRSSAGAAKEKVERLKTIETACTICAVPFEHVGRRAKICSPQCRRESQRRSAERHRERQRATA